MKSVIKTNDLKGEIEYPCLMTVDNVDNSSGAIVVLFTNNHFGTVVYSERKGQPIGYSSEDWVISDFTPFNGTIQLTND